MKKTLKELREEYDVIVAQMEEINAAEEVDQEAFDGLEVELKSVDAQIKNAEKLEDLKKERVAKLANVNGGAPKIGRSEAKEVSNYSWTKAFSDVKTHKEVKGLEAEMLQDAQREANNIGVALEGNIAIPQKYVIFPAVDGQKGEKRIKAGEFTVAGEGADIVDTDFGGLIPLLSIQPKVIDAGATLLRGQSSNIHYPKFTVGPTLGWKGEITAVDKTTPEMGNVTLSPNKLGGYVQISNQALYQTSSFDLERVMRDELSKAFSREFDRVAIEGAGSANEPEGVMTISGTGSVTTTSNVVKWADLLKFPKELAAANVEFDNDDCAFMGSATVESLLMGEAKDSGSGRFLLENGVAAGYRFIRNNNVPDDLTTDTHSALIFGKWEDLIMAQFGPVSIMADPYSDSLSGITRFVINVYLDSKVSQAESFAIASDIAN